MLDVSHGGATLVSPSCAEHKAGSQRKDTPCLLSGSSGWPLCLEKSDSQRFLPLPSLSGVQRAEWAHRVYQPASAVGIAKCPRLLNNQDHSSLSKSARQHRSQGQDKYIEPEEVVENVFIFRQMISSSNK